MRGLEQKAGLLVDQGKFSEAAEVLKEVYSYDVPKDSPFYELKVRMVGHLAKTYAAAGRKAEALDTVKKMLADVPAGGPPEAAAWLEAGAVYKKLGMTQEALDAFDRSIEMSKKLAQTWTPPARDSWKGPEPRDQGQRPSGPGTPPPAQGPSP
jgi:tetratricopeptide (TPR) repeat protein